MDPVTSYHFRLPDGQTYGGESPEQIFALYPEAVITHVFHRDQDGAETRERLDPPLSNAPEPAGDFAADLEAEWLAENLEPIGGSGGLGGTATGDDVLYLIANDRVHQFGEGEE